jgi:cell division protein ZapA
MARQPVRVQIFNQSYTLLSDSDPAEVQAIAHEIDELMGSISSQTSSADSTRIAVLACFHLADKLRAAEKQLHEMEHQSDRIAVLLEEALGPA